MAYRWLKKMDIWSALSGIFLQSDGSCTGGTLRDGACLYVFRMLGCFHEKSYADFRRGIPSLYKSRTLKGTEPCREKGQRGFSKHSGCSQNATQDPHSGLLPDGQPLPPGHWEQLRAHGRFLQASQRRLRHVLPKTPRRQRICLPGALQIQASLSVRSYIITFDLIRWFGDSWICKK